MPAYHRRGRPSAWPIVFVWIFFGAIVISAYPQGAPSAGQSAAVSIKPDSRKAKEAFQAGQAAEQKQEWEAAYEAFSQAVEYAPNNKTYLLRRQAAKAGLVQSHVDAAERAAIADRFDDARRELLIASDLDPTNAVIRERLAEILAEQKPANPGPQLAGEPHLDYQQGTRDFNYRGDTRGAYDEIARQFGVRDSFDSDLVSHNVQLVLKGVDFPSVMRILGDMTGTFWQPVTSHLFFVAQNTPQKRRDLGQSAIRTVLLPTSESTDQMTETLRVVRDLTGITRATLDTNTHTLTLRASPQALALASNLIDGIEQPLGQMVLEFEVLEVDRNYARDLGITPPEHSQVYTLSPQQITEANQSASNLVSVISQVFGLPTSLSGLSPTQIAGLLASGTLGASTLLPPLVAFGGGESTFLATLPGAAANFSQMLSLVKRGQRIFLRAEDGQPATAFFGEQFPVSLATYSSSLSEGSIPGVTSANFPTTTYNAGNAPQFITSAILRANSPINDLIVANQLNGNVGVFLGNGVTDGDGTFATQATYATDPANPASVPVWIATGDFDEASGFTDLAIANKASNNIGILLASTAGDGSFQPATTIPTGTAPVSVIAGHFHDAVGNHIDLAVANQADNSISIFQGNGDGTFVTPATILQLPAGYLPAGLATADLNADGHTDLIVADEGNNSVSVFLSNGNGTFQPRVDYATGEVPVYVAADDLNADGILDLAIANNGAATATNSGNSVTILLGQKNSLGAALGTFAPGPTRDFPAGTAPTSLVIGDFNIDGIPDLIVSDGNTVATATAGDNTISVLLGAGDGTFSTNFELPVGTNPQSIVSADFNDDSKPDIASANAGSSNITVVLNSSELFSGAAGNGSAGTPYPNVQYIDIGLKVKATPRIHGDDEVTLALEFTINSLSTQSFNSIPALNNESLKHTVRLKQNQTSVIASFLAPQTSTILSGTPSIAGVPGIGWLAQDQNVANQNTELVILVTPRMVRYAPRENRAIYAGQGSLEGPGAPPGGGAPVFAPPQPNQLPPGASQLNVPPQGQQPGTPQPGAPQSRAQQSGAQLPAQSQPQPQTQPAAQPPNQQPSEQQQPPSQNQTSPLPSPGEQATPQSSPTTQ